MPFVGQQDVSQTFPLFALHFSCPNDDSRPTFNHYLHCPFNNYSTPLHNFNSKSMRWILLINCLMQTQSFGAAPSHPPTIYDAFKGNDGKFDFSSTYYSCCIIQGKPTTIVFHSLTEAKLRLHMQNFKNVTHPHSWETAKTCWSKRRQKK